MRDEVVGLKDKANGMVAVGIPIGVGKVLGRLVVYDKVAGGVLVKPADDVQQRRLAAAGVTEDRDKFVLTELQIHALERVDGRVANGVILLNVLKFEHYSTFYAKNLLTYRQFCVTMYKL